MSTIWMLLLRAALTIAIQAVSRIPESQWAKLSDVIVNWLAKIQEKLPTGSPAFTAFDAYRAPASKLARFRDNPTD